MEDAAATGSWDRARACAAQAGLELARGDDGVVLKGAGMELRPDFADLLPRVRPGALGRELVVRAARIKGGKAPRFAIDATAGLGEDAFLLAAAGFTVTLYEADPVIAALLRDALDRAASVPALAPITGRMRLVEGDSIAALRALASALASSELASSEPASSEAFPLAPVPPDVVYLDPMFPERRHAAAVKKKFQLLHHLERPCDIQDELLAAALGVHPRKVVIKRPAKGPCLAGVKPSYTIGGKAVRFDVVVPPRS